MPISAPNVGEEFENLVGNRTLALRTERIVLDGLGLADEFSNRKVPSWDRAERLMRLESNSSAALEMGIHMGEAFRAREDAAGRFHRAVFGNARTSMLSAELEDEGSDEQARLASALVEEQLRQDVGLERRGLELTREVFTYGCVYAKIIPEFIEKTVIRRRATAVEITPRRRSYRISKGKIKKIEQYRIKGQFVSPRYFRYSPGAADIEDALWCGDWSTMDEVEFNRLVEQDIYGGPHVSKILSHFKKQKASTLGGSLRDSFGRSLLKAGDSDQANASVRRVKDAGNAGQIAVFEWYGLLPLGDGADEVEPAFAAIAFPIETLGQTHVLRGKGNGWIVSVGRNPYDHQRKPYSMWPCIKLSADADGMSVVDVTSRHSDYSDEFASLGMMRAYLDVSPPMLITDDEISDEELTGFLPGKKIRTQKKDGITYPQMPANSGNAFQVAEFFQRKDRENIGLGGVSDQPRVAAAGILEQTQAEDLRLMMLVDPYEQYFLVNAAELIHAYNRQYMTKERAVQVLGMRGVNARTRETVDPTHLAVDIRFEPVIGKRLSMKGFQMQGMLNAQDRMLLLNQARAAQGRPELFDLAEIWKWVMADGFGMADVDRFIVPESEPELLRTPPEEHELFGMAQRPGVQKGERLVIHAMAHLQYWQAGAPGLTEPEDRLAFFDHLIQTIERLAKQVAAAMPDMGDVVRTNFAAMLGGQEGSRPGFGPGPAQGGQPGGRGIAGPGQSPGSPLVRRPTQGSTMSQTFNGGAQ